jgi:hypothetical protein
MLGSTGILNLIHSAKLLDLTVFGSSILADIPSTNMLETLDGAFQVIAIFFFTFGVLGLVCVLWTFIKERIRKP